METKFENIHVKRIINNYTISVPTMIVDLLSEIGKEDKNAFFPIYNNSAKIAGELSLIFASYFTHTIFNIDKEVTLNAKVMEMNLTKNYHQIVKLFLKHNIIELVANFSYTNNTSRKYKLNNKILNHSRIKKYKITDNRVKEFYRKSMYRMLAAAEKNYIARRTLLAYMYVDLPSEAKVKNRAFYLVKNKIEKGGKIYRARYKDNYKKNTYRFVDKDIKRYKFYVEPSYIIPNISEKVGRVYHTFNMIPSWIRELLNIEGEQMVEVDFAALHPNIAVSLFHGFNSPRHINHQEIADYLNTTKAEVKEGHLRYFNEPVKKMNLNPVDKFYEDKFPSMIDGIKKIKEKNYRAITYKLFNLETKIMEECMRRFEKEQIVALYIFDAFGVAESKVERTKQIMNEVAEMYNVLTIAK